MNNDDMIRRGAVRSTPRPPVALRPAVFTPRQPGETYAPPLEQVVQEATEATEMSPLPQPVHELSFAPPEQPGPVPVSQQLPPPLPVEPIMRPIPVDPVVLQPIAQEMRPETSPTAVRRPTVRLQDIMTVSPKPALAPITTSPVTKDDLMNDELLSFPDSTPAEPKEELPKRKVSILKRIFRRSS